MFLLPNPEFHGVNGTVHLNQNHNEHAGWTTEMERRKVIDVSEGIYFILRIYLLKFSFAYIHNDIIINKLYNNGASLLKSHTHYFTFVMLIGNEFYYYYVRG